MALKADRIETQTDVSFFMDNATASTIERGGIASISGGGSGVSMDDAAAKVVYATTASGSKPVGVLLNDVVNLDLTRQHINYHKDEVQGGSKVTLLQVGQITTDKIATDVTPAAGDVAYLGGTGLFTSTPTDDADTADENNMYQVGRFLSSEDANGFCKIAINIA